MNQYTIAYLATAIVFVAIDTIWLTVTAERLYREHLADLLADRFDWAPAALFYLVYAAGIVVFAVSPALKADHWPTAAVRGALLGLCAYATYDLTNQATIREWPPVVTVIDLWWGTTLTATTATCGYLIARCIIVVF